MVKYTFFALAFAAIAFAAPAPLDAVGSLTGSGALAGSIGGIVDNVGGLTGSAEGAVSAAGSLTDGLEKRDGGVSIVIGDIQMFTQMSNDLNTVASNLNIVNCLFQGPKIAAGFRNIVKGLPLGGGHLVGMSPLNNADATNVVIVLKTFVTVHQRLLNTVIGKHGLLSLFFFTEPVRVALVALEAAVDTYALALIGLIPTKQADGNEGKRMLDVSIRGAITVYS